LSAERLREESGYSLVEVMVSMLILTIAIIPMVGMFDMGLRAATSSGNYDTARTFANKKLEQAKSLPYESSTATDIKDNFPYAAPISNPTNGDTTAPITSSTEEGVPNGFSYTVRKQYKCVSASAGSCTNPTSATSVLRDSDTDRGFIEVRVTVSWDGSSYTTSGIVARGTV
jgi:prepilin-type N-terminal cleavage/methylation domain-containing protein